MPLTLEQLNQASREEAARMLDGLYEHSPWIAEQALAQRPFRSLAQLKHAMCEVLAQAGREAQLGLIRAHPELAGKEAQQGTLTAASTHERWTAMRSIERGAGGGGVRSARRCCAMRGRTHPMSDTKSSR